MMAQRGVDSLFNLGARWGLGGQRHVQAALPPRKETRYRLYRMLGGPQGRSRRVRKISLPTGIQPRTAQPVTSSHTNCTT